MSKPKRKHKKNAAISYRPSLVCFIDVLGFRALLNSKPAHEVHEILLRLRHTTEPENYPGVSNTEISLPQWFQVSDAVVRVRHYDTEYRDGALFHEIFDLGLAQANLARSGVFIRGGLAIGDASTGKDGEGPAFGPAFVKAYEIESQMAVYPRISISHGVVEAYKNGRDLKSENHDSDMDEDYVQPMIIQSATGPSIDYMAVVRNNEETEEHVSFCADHADRIRDCFSRFGDNPAVMQKFLWLAAYHNQHVQPFADDPAGISASKWLEVYGFDGVAVFEEALIEPPFGWKIPDCL